MPGAAGGSGDLAGELGELFVAEAEAQAALVGEQVVEEGGGLAEHELLELAEELVAVDGEQGPVGGAVREVVELGQGSC